MAAKKNYTVKKDDKIIIINKIPLTPKEKEEVDQMVNYLGYTIGEKPKRKASAIARLTKDHIKALVKGSKEAEADFERLVKAKTPIMRIKKELREKYPDIFTDKAIKAIVK